MNKRYINILLCLAAVVLCMSSCRDRSDDREPVEVETLLTLTLEPGKWIYYSISDSSIVGRSDIGDAEQDQEWAAQLNWDIAFSESGIRTNGGTSGRGKGGLTVISDSIYSLTKQSSLFNLVYTPDTLGVTVIKPLN